MPRWRCLALTLVLALPVAAQVPPDKALATMQPGDGLTVELFAAEPMLVNPTAIDVDHKGRVWVAEAVNYRRVNFKRPILREEGDRIVVLTDTDGDGKADRSDVFYQGKELYGPLSVLVLPQADGKAVRVLVAQSPDILEFWDRDGDGKADGPPTKWLSGFGGFDHDHGVHGLTTGPDGKLYFTVGDAGVTGLQSKDGKGKKWVTKAGSDCQAGTVWRCDLDGTNLELIAHNFRNNYEATVDSFGEIWLSDNDDDGNQQTRICHVLPGGNYGYWPRGLGQTHWHEEQPGIVHKTLRTGFGSPCGIAFYEGSLLPEKFRGQLLHADAGPREIRCFYRKPKGAGYELDKTLMLTSTDGWFRPSDVCVAPDGSVFVADWYDPGVGGHGMGDWTRGRIYRLTPTGHKGYKVPKVDLDTTPGFVDAVRSPNGSVRLLAETNAGRSTIPPAFKQLGRGIDPFTDARLSWMTISATKNSQTAQNVALTVLAGDDSRLKAMGERIMQQYPNDRAGRDLREIAPAVALRALARVPADVRREMALSLGHRSVNAETQMLYYLLAKLYDGDPTFRAALNIALGTDPARRDAILADFDKHFPEWNDKVADLAWELRPKSVLGRLDTLLADPKLTAAQKARLVDILAVNDDPAAGAKVLGLLAADQSAEVRAKALDNLRLFLPTKWKAVATGDELKATVGKLLGDPKTVPVGLQLVAAAGHTPAIEAVARLATGDSKAEAVRTLGKLRDPKAVAALAKLTDDPNAVAALGELAAGPGSTQAVREAVAALQKLVTDGNQKSAALTALAGTRAGTGWLLKLKEDGKFPPDLLAAAGPLLRNSPFQGERNKAMILFPAAGGLAPKTRPPVAVVAKKPGDAARGKALLLKTTTGEAQCLKCHKVGNEGGQIGPDLSLIGKKASVENLLESLLYPSKAIADQFVTWKVDTADGVSITGLLVSESESTVTIRDANGKDYPIPVKDIDRRTKSLVSLMPEDSVRTLTEQELLDLVAYLATLKD